MRRFAIATVALSFSLGLLACGGPPPFAEIESQLNAPTLTLSGPVIQQSFKTYNHGQMAVSMPGLSEYGKMASFLVVEDGSTTHRASMKQYLVKSGVPAKLADRIAPYLPVNNDLSLKKTVKSDGKFSVMKQAFKAQCVETRLNLGFMGNSGSFHYIVDLGCEGVGSGKIELKAAVQGNANSGQLRFSTNFMNACTLDKHCLNGSLVYKMEGTASSAGASGSMLVSMYFEVSNPSGDMATIKQGMRISFDSARKAAKLETLVYAKDAEGNEGTAVLEIQVNVDQGSFAIRGNNGRFVCKTSDAGQTGQCYAEGAEGSATYSW